MRVCLLSFVLFLLPLDASAYGVLAHEAIIDATWYRSLAPLLQERFHPTDDELRCARAYAYGGSLIQDLGYFPFSSRRFGDMTHYVRSGDFVLNLINQASDANEYAFALGALAHYVGDMDGHPLAVNRAVPLLYPRLRARFGDAIAYEQNPGAHLKTEFGFDVLQVASGSFAPQDYHSFIGFEISKPVLERAFRATYGLDLKDVFGDIDFSIGSFRFAVHTMIPKMTKVAWQIKHEEIESSTPGMTQERFLFASSQPDYEREWGNAYGHPGIGSKILAVILRIVPKVGPFSSLAFKPPTPAAEQLFVATFHVTVDHYAELIDAVAHRGAALENRNLDTGEQIRAGDYARADEAYASLLDMLASGGFRDVSADLRRELLSFFANYPRASSRFQKRWRKLSGELEQLDAHVAN